MNVEEVQTSVDRFDKAELVGEGVNGADATLADAAAAVGDLIVDVACGHHGFFAAAQVIFVNAALDPALAASQLLLYVVIRSKSLLASDIRAHLTLSTTPQTPSGFE